ncbi:MAG: hypothetical protein R3Y57_02225 [Erysipelotrichaceae bacterium]
MIEKDLVKVPLLFQDNRIQRFYIGGKVLNEWRRMPAAEDNHQCEELLATSIGAISKGHEDGYAISKTIQEQGSHLLSEIIKAYPNEILGERFQTYNPNHLSVLARVGDTIVRLVMQCHLMRDDARKYFNMPMGKTEAWYMAETRETEAGSPCVYVGFKKFVTPAIWKERFDAQDIEGMLECMHKIPVSKGDTILIPAGMPHACGQGCLFLEYHECNDVTIRLERDINGLTLADEEMFNGLKADEGMKLFNYTTYDEEEIKEVSVMKKNVLEKTDEYEYISLIDQTKNDSFGIDLVHIHGSYSLKEFDGHRVIVAVTNDVELKANGQTFTLVQGHSALIPASCKDLEMVATDCSVTIGIPYIA